MLNRGQIHHAKASKTAAYGGAEQGASYVPENECRRAAISAKLNALLAGHRHRIQLRPTRCLTPAKIASQLGQSRRDRDRRRRPETGVWSQRLIAVGRRDSRTQLRAGDPLLRWNGKKDCRCRYHELLLT